MKFRCVEAKYLLLVLCLILVTSVAMIGCGKDEGTPTPTPTPTSTGVDLTNKKVGVISYIEAASGPHRESLGALEVGRVLGWQVTIADGEALPQKFLASMQNFIAENVDAILLWWVSPDQVSPALPDAGKAGIIVADLMSGPSTPDKQPWNDISYDPAAVAALQLQGIINMVGENAKIYAITDNDTVAPRMQWEAFEALVAEHPGLQIVGQHESRVEDQYADVTSATATALVQNPDLDAFWCVADPQAGAVLSQLGAEGRTDVAVVGMNGDEQILAAIREGTVPVQTVGLGQEEGIWYLFDFILATLAGQSYGTLPKVPIQLITADNVTPEGTLYEGSHGFRERFVQEWNSAYGLNLTLPSDLQGR